jgi:hypothetical protein
VGYCWWKGNDQGLGALVALMESTPVSGLFFFFRTPRGGSPQTFYAPLAVSSSPGLISNLHLHPSIATRSVSSFSRCVPSWEFKGEKYCSQFPSDAIFDLFCLVKWRKKNSLAARAWFVVISP